MDGFIQLARLVMVVAVIYFVGKFVEKIRPNIGPKQEVN
jgi:hypothetical protein